MTMRWGALLAVGLLVMGADWPGSEMPLQLSVRSPEDLAFKAAAEKQYLIFNLLGAGKLAWDKGDFATAAARWDSLLRVPGVPAEVDALVRPLLVTARSKAGQGATELPAPVAAVVAPETPKKTGPVTVSGTLTGGGKLGPGGAVVFLKRLDGQTPKARAGKPRVISQKDKRFNPRVLAVTVGTPVEFENVDAVFHNVFSLSKPNDFDLGLYKNGTSKDKVFTSPGAVQLLCNIHSSMLGWVFVVDTPYFAQADGDGKYSIKGVPPGEYQVQVWHENASKFAERTIKVTDHALDGVGLSIDADRAAPTFVPDKAGKPRQPQLGY